MKETLFYPLHHQYKDAHSSVYNNRGFLYGDGFFETMRISKGAVPFFADHCNRITKTLDALQFKHDFSPELLLRDIASVVSNNGIWRELRCRLTFFRTGNGFYTPLSNEPAMVMQLMEIPERAFNKDGLSTCIYKENVKPVTSLSNYKTLNCLVYVLAGIFATRNGCDDALLFNSKGAIIEATSSNLFIYKNNSLLTPPLEDGCVNGIVRRNIISLAGEMKLSVNETSITLDDIIDAEEVLLTNAVSTVQYIKDMLKTHFRGEFAMHLFNALKNQMHGATI